MSEPHQIPNPRQNNTMAAKKGLLNHADFGIGKTHKGKFPLQGKKRPFWSRSIRSRRGNVFGPNPFDRQKLAAEGYFRPK